MAKATGATRLPKKDYEARVPALCGVLVQMQVSLQRAPFAAEIPRETIPLLEDLGKSTAIGTAEASAL